MSDKITSVIAKEESGNIQITFTIPWVLIQKAQEETLAEMAGDVEVPGFRKGQAPLDKVKEKIPQGKIIEHALSHLLPKALADSIEEHKLKIAIYPRFELIKADADSDWQIKGVTCEIPEVKLGDYKKNITGALRSGSIVVPGQDKKEPTKAEKESLVLKALLDSVSVNIPSVLVEEEAEGRLSDLLSRLEKLGLTLEGYLKNLNKSVEDLRAEYAKGAKDAILIDLILNQVAQEQNIKVESTEVSEAYEISKNTNPTTKDTVDDEVNRKRLIESIIRRRKALDYLLSVAS